MVSFFFTFISSAVQSVQRHNKIPILWIVCKKNVNDFSFLFVAHWILNRFPFEWTNPRGYFAAVILESILITYPVCYVGCFISLALGAYLFATSINRYITDDLKSINEMTRDKKSKSDIFKQLSASILAHTKVKQLSAEQWFIYASYEPMV